MTPAEGVERSVRLAVAADEAGFDSLWLSEDPDGWDAFATLGALAMRTAAIRLGPGVTSPYLRHPNLIAASVATLDRLSGGRAFLGLGRGQAEWFQTALGLRAGPPLAALEATVRLLRQWWTPPHRASDDGPFPVDDWGRTLPPVQPAPGPPIYLAATGPRTQTLAGRVADGVRFNELASAAYLGESIARVKAAAEDVGRDPGGLQFFAHPGITVTDRPEAALERKKAVIAIVHALPGMERQLETPGFDIPAIMAEVRKAMRTDEVLRRGGSFADMRAAGDMTAAKAAIPTALVDRVAIVGTAAAVAGRLRELTELGVTHTFLNVGPWVDDPQELRSVVGEITPANVGPS